MPEIPPKITAELNKIKQSFKNAWVGFDSKRNEYFVSIIPYSFLKSNLLIVKI